MDIAKGLYNDFSGDLGWDKGIKPARSWNDQSAQDFRVNDYGIPELTIYDFGNGGTKTTLYGNAALANTSDPYGRSLRYRYQMPPEALTDLKLKDDPNDSLGSRIGRKLHSIATSDEPTFIGRMYNKGPLVGAALTGLAGYGAGKLADRFLGEGLIPKKTLGLALGGILGTIIGQAREKNASAMEKRGATFNNPRNFILEKLQSANDISTLQKAQLAAKVRAMDTASAERLKTMVRAAVGFGVGSIIAKFFFGTGIPGTLIGGMIGAVAHARAGRPDDKGRSYLL